MGMQQKGGLLLPVLQLSLRHISLACRYQKFLLLLIRRVDVNFEIAVLLELVHSETTHYCA